MKFCAPFRLAAAFLVSVGSLFQMGSRAALANPLAPQDDLLSGGGPAVTLTADGAVLDWRTPPVEIALLAGGAVRVTLPGYPAQGDPGAPLLPTGVALLALPPDADPTLQVLEAEEQVLPLPGPIMTAPLPSTDGLEQSPASSAIETAAPISETAHLDNLGEVRGTHLARVTFHPARPEGNTLRVTTHLRVSVDFHAPASALTTAETAAVTADPVLASLQAAVVNPSQVLPLPARAAPGRLTPAASSPVAAIDVITPGITAITYEALQTAGFTVTDPALLHLVRRTGTVSQKVALQWDNAVHTFAPGDQLLFYAAPRFSRWTTADTYFLSEEAVPGLRMASRDASPIGLLAGVGTQAHTAEVNALYMPSCYCGYLPPGRDGDHWAWAELKLGGISSGSYTLSLTDVDVTRPATLTVWLIGGTDVAAAPDHRVNIALNSSGVLTQTQWDGKLAITATIPLAAGVLQNGVNTLRLALPGIPGVLVESAWLDAFSITYARSSAVSGLAASFTGEASPHAYTLGLASTSGLRVYDVSDAAQPVVLTGVTTTTTSLTLGDPGGGLPRRYAVAAEGGVLAPPRMRLTSPLAASPGADYLIITHPDFAPALADLVSLRQSQGYTVTVENVQAIYDAYDGRPDPEAIRAYLQNAYATWSPPPTYVLLVGDGNVDPKHYLSNSSETFIPPYLADADYAGGETAADNQYVASNGVGSLPNMLIGRLPANTPAEAQAMVNKIVRYDTQPWVGDWNSLATFVAGASGIGEDFAGQSNAAAALLPSSITPQRLYFTSTSNESAARQAVQQAWNRGAGIMVYTGHASWHQWNASPILFHYNDVSGLSNGGWLPVVLEMTCFTSYFQRPDMGTLDEALVRHPGGGAVATWGSTGLGLTTGHQALAAGFITAIYQANTTLGQAALQGKLQLAGTPDLVDTYTLLGDPATALNTTVRPWPVHLYLPAVRR